MVLSLAFFAYSHNRSSILEREVDIVIAGGGVKAQVLDGVTTMICGNCGIHPYHSGKYFNSLKQEGCLINYAILCGHNILRREVGLKDRNTGATSAQLVIFLVSWALGAGGG